MWARAVLAATILIWGYGSERVQQGHNLRGLENLIIQWNGATGLAAPDRQNVQQVRSRVPASRENVLIDDTSHHPYRQVYGLYIWAVLSPQCLLRHDIGERNVTAEVQCRCSIWKDGDSAVGPMSVAQLAFSILPVNEIYDRLRMPEDWGNVYIDVSGRRMPGIFKRKPEHKINAVWSNGQWIIKRNASGGNPRALFGLHLVQLPLHDGLLAFERFQLASGIESGQKKRDYCGEIEEKASALPYLIRALVGCFLLAASGALIVYALKRGDYLLVPLLLAAFILFDNGMVLAFPWEGGTAIPSCLQPSSNRTE